jgi:hypothetical protein
MALFQSLRIVALLIVMSNNLARYEIMASLLSFRISLGMPPGPIDLFLPIAAVTFHIMLMLMVKGSPE